MKKLLILLLPIFLILNNQIIKSADESKSELKEFEEQNFDFTELGIYLYKNLSIKLDNGDYAAAAVNNDGNHVILIIRWDKQYSKWLCKETHLGHGALIKSIIQLKNNNLVSSDDDGTIIIWRWSNQFDIWQKLQTLRNWNS